MRGHAFEPQAGSGAVVQLRNKLLRLHNGDPATPHLGPRRVFAPDLPIHLAGQHPVRTQPDWPEGLAMIAAAEDLMTVRRTQQTHE
ncbi:hypothetical protein GCM10027569_36900 [Flindersiella endophytica]